MVFYHEKWRYKKMMTSLADEVFRYVGATFPMMILKTIKRETLNV